MKHKILGKMQSAAQFGAALITISILCPANIKLHPAQ